MEPNPTKHPIWLDQMNSILFHLFNNSHTCEYYRGWSFDLWTLSRGQQFAECEWKQNFIAKKTSYSDLDSQRWYKSPWIHLIWEREAKTFAMNEN